MRIKLVKQFGSNPVGAVLESEDIGYGVADALVRGGKAERIDEPEPVVVPAVKSVTAKARRKVNS